MLLLLPALLSMDLCPYDNPCLPCYFWAYPASILNIGISWLWGIPTGTSAPCYSMVNPCNPCTLCGTIGSYGNPCSCFDCLSCCNPVSVCNSLSICNPTNLISCLSCFDAHSPPIISLINPANCCSLCGSICSYGNCCSGVNAVGSIANPCSGCNLGIIPSICSPLSGFKTGVCANICVPFSCLDIGMCANMAEACTGISIGCLGNCCQAFNILNCPCPNYAQFCNILNLGGFCNACTCENICGTFNFVGSDVFSYCNCGNCIPLPTVADCWYFLTCGCSCCIITAISHATLASCMCCLNAAIKCCELGVFGIGGSIMTACASLCTFICCPICCPMMEATYCGCIWCPVDACLLLLNCIGIIAFVAPCAPCIECCSTCISAPLSILLTGCGIICTACFYPCVSWIGYLISGSIVLYILTTCVNCSFACFNWIATYITEHTCIGCIAEVIIVGCTSCLSCICLPCAPCIFCLICPVTSILFWSLWMAWICPCCLLTNMIIFVPCGCCGCVTSICTIPLDIMCSAIFASAMLVYELTIVSTITIAGITILIVIFAVALPCCLMASGYAEIMTTAGWAFMPLLEQLGALTNSVLAFSGLMIA